MTAMDNALPVLDFGGIPVPEQPALTESFSKPRPDWTKSGGTPLWFGPAQRPLFGWAHGPNDGLVSAGVVLCPPLGLERTNAHYAFRRLAESLSEHRFLALRFDYDGTGDSAGSDTDAGRVEAWLSSVSHAIDYVRDAGCTTVVLVGMRMGAVMAAHAASFRSKVDGVVLWDPCKSGRDFLKQQRAMQLLQFGSDDDQGCQRELPGWSLRSDEVEGIELLTLPETAVLSQCLQRALFLSRPTNSSVVPPPNPPGGSRIEWGPAMGQPELLDVNPIDFKMPHETIETITDWIADHFGSPLHPIQLQVTGRAVLAEEGHRVVERLSTFGAKGLFGIVTTPLEEPSGEVPWVVFLNSGNDSHVGPCRLWVQLARRWAGLGLPSIRFDLGGLGDSPSEQHAPGTVIRSAEAFEEIEEVATTVLPGRPSDLVLIGLCSGGYQALDSAITWKFGSLRAVYAINAIVRFTPPEMAAGPMDRRRRLCRPAHPYSQSSRRLSTGPLRRALWWITWCLRHPGRLRRGRWIAKLVDGGTDVWCLGGDLETQELKDAIGLESDDSANPPLMTTRQGLDHGLVRGIDRQWVADQLTRRLECQFALAPERSTGAKESAAP